MIRLYKRNPSFCGTRNTISTMDVAISFSHCRLKSKKGSFVSSFSSQANVDFDFEKTYFNYDMEKIKLQTNTNLKEKSKNVINLLLQQPIPPEEKNYQIFEENPSSIKFNNYSELMLKQIKLENTQHEKAVNDYLEGLQVLLKLGKGTGLKHFRQFMFKWYTPLLEEIDREKELVLKKVGGVDRNCYGPCLLLLPTEKLAVITMNTSLNHILKSGNSGVNISTLAAEIGDVIKTEIDIVSLIKKKDQLSNWQKELIDNAIGNARHAKMLTIKLRNFLDEEEWTPSIKVKIGSALLNFLIETAKTDIDTNAFEHRYIYDNPTIGKSNKRKGMLFLDTPFFESMSLKDLTYVSPRYMPMIIPPKPWDNKAMTGGYYELPSQLIRTHSQLQINSIKRTEMNEILEGLDYLGSIPWRVNSKILDIVVDAWKEGLTIGELPSLENLPYPKKEDFYVPKKKVENEEELTEDILNQVSTATAIPPSPPPTTTDNNNSDLNEENELEFDSRRYKQVCARIKAKNCELHSLRADMHLKLWIAKEFQNQDIYYPHNLDFRGRAYPIPPNLSHLGSDICRGLLTFAEGKPLGEEGFRWLKIQLCNLFGNNKISHDERMKWTEAHWNDIVDSARNPLHGQKWWSTAEEPFQALAVCIDLIAAVESGNPITYISNIPVHQDGSCNGLQHYAALGGDASGAYAVNLSPSDRPQDVYSAVLNIIKVQIDNDALIPSEGVPAPLIKRGEYARLLQGKVDRRVVKQTVMTSVYGVTKIGARAQIQNKLKEKFMEDKNQLLSQELERNLYLSSLYLANVTLESLGKMFVSATRIMTWLATAAKLVAAAGHSMSWLTPLGLPVIQPYRHEKPFIVKTILQNISLVSKSDTLPVASSKQRTAFPPNYVHSLDATHMIITCLKMKEKGLTFAAVHDSYWTHACDVPVINEAIRESFIELYSIPLLENLRDSLMIRYPNIDFPPLPKRGDFDINLVKDSKYFFH